MSVKVIDRGWNKIVSNTNKLNNASVKIGFPAEGEVGNPLTEGSGHDLYQDIPDVATIAFWLEFGTIKMDGWPFMRNAWDQNKTILRQLRDKVYKKVQDGTISVEKGLSILGQRLTSLIQNEIRDLKHPDISEQTKKRKGSDNPLIDTGQMVQSVQYTVISGNGTLKSAT